MTPDLGKMSEVGQPDAAMQDARKERS